MVVVGIAVSGLFLWLALRGTDPTAILAALRKADPRWAVPYFAALSASYLFKAARWKRLLIAAPEASVRRLLPPIMVGHLGNLLLPVQLGELLRIAAATRQIRAPVPMVIASIVIERAFDLATVLLILIAALALGAQQSPALERATLVTAVFLSLLTLSAIVLFLGSRWIAAPASALRRALPDTIRLRVLATARQASEGLQVFKSPGALGRVIALSILQWGSLLFCVWFSLIALGIEAPPAAILLVLGFSVVGVSLPTSPGFIGAIQLAFALGLGPFGIDVDRAFAASVYYHLLAVLAVIVFGIVGLRDIGMRLSRIRDEAEGLDRP